MRDPIQSISDALNFVSDLDLPPEVWDNGRAAWAALEQLEALRDALAVVLEHWRHSYCDQRCQPEIDAAEQVLAASLPTPPTSGSGDHPHPETSHEEGRQAQDPRRTDRPR